MLHWSQWVRLDIHQKLIGWAHQLLCGMLTLILQRGGIQLDMYGCCDRQ